MKRKRESDMNRVHPEPPHPVAVVPLFVSGGGEASVVALGGTDKRKKKYVKRNIPSALKHAVWVHYVGKHFETKCCVSWCPSIIDTFSFEAGHDVPESKGGEMTIGNLRPICSSCNKSMGNRYTIAEFSALFGVSADAVAATTATASFPGASAVLSPRASASNIIVEPPAQRIQQMQHMPHMQHHASQDEGPWWRTLICR